MKKRDEATGRKSHIESGLHAIMDDIRVSYISRALIKIIIISKFSNETTVFFPHSPDPLCLNARITHDTNKREIGKKKQIENGIEKCDTTKWNENRKN